MDIIWTDLSGIEKDKNEKNYNKFWISFLFSFTRSFLPKRFNLHELYTGCRPYENFNYGYFLKEMNISGIGIHERCDCEPMFTENITRKKEMTISENI